MPKKSENTSNKPRARTGSTLLDLVVGGGRGLGFPFGKIINIVGDKSTGKTFLACEIIANNGYAYGKKFKHNYDDGEEGFTFDTKSLYGVSIAGEKDLKSKKIEQFDYHVGKFLKGLDDGDFGIYVLDSLDGLSNEEIDERAEKRFRAAEQGKDFKEGTYGMKTPKFLSQEFFRTKTSEFSEKQAILLIISQVRQNIDPYSFKKFDRSGGKAMDFFAHTCLWLAPLRKIEKSGRVVGVFIKARTDKSKTPRPFRDCVIPLFFDYGIDNIGANVDYLFDLRTESQWKLKAEAEAIPWDGGKEKTLANLTKWLKENDLYDEAKAARKADDGKTELSKAWIIEWATGIRTEGRSKHAAKFNKDFGNTMTREELINKILADPKMEAELERRVIEKWEAEEAAVATGRKRKYS